MSGSWLQSGVSQGNRGSYREAAQALPDELLLQICRATNEDTESSPEQWLKDLRAVPRMIGAASEGGAGLELALALLAAVLGELPCHRPAQLSARSRWGQIQPYCWIDEEALDLTGKQIAGLVWHDSDPEAVARSIEHGICEAIRLGFLEDRHYDAWRPGMPSGSGWRFAVMATPYGVTKAQIYHYQHVTASIERAPAPEPPEQEHPLPDDMEDDVAEKEPDAAPAPAPGPGPTPTPEPEQASAPTVDEHYRWARQIELVNATNQVLGQGMLNKGVLSRACRARCIQTNGRPGKASRVFVPDFLVWVLRQFPMSKDEQTQIRNAIIGEINARN